MKEEISRADVIADIDQWIDWVSKFRTELGNPICPFAKVAKKHNRIAVEFADASKLAEAVENQVVNWNESIEIVIVVVEGDISADELFEFCRRAFAENYRQRDFFLLPDHPDRPFQIGGVPTRTSKVAKVLVQRLGRLNDAAKALMAGSYYESWDPAMYEQIVAARF